MLGVGMGATSLCTSATLAIPPPLVYKKGVFLVGMALPSWGGIGSLLHLLFCISLQQPVRALAQLHICNAIISLMQTLMGKATVSLLCTIAAAQVPFQAVRSRQCQTASKKFSPFLGCGYWP